MTNKLTLLAAVGGSLLLLASALWFQYLGGLPPCPLCIWQRWAHLTAILIGIAAIRFPWRLLPWGALFAVLAGSAVAFYHVGVEQGVFEGLASCAGDSLSGKSAADLLNLSSARPAASCSEVPWSFAGLSMAGWNGLLSLLVAGIWALAIARTGHRNEADTAL